MTVHDDQTPPLPGWRSEAHLHYDRRGVYARLQLKGLVNHEIRSMIVGLWARLDADDRADMIGELTHYNGQEGGHLPAIAGVVARALANADGRAVDLTRERPFFTPVELP